MGKRPNILLVDDDRNIANITREYLEAKGLEVSVAFNAEDGFTLFKNTAPDICLLDIKMPIKDGFSLAEDIRKLRPRTSIIFLTGKKEKDDRIKGLLLGADDYITKPFSMQELYLRITNLYNRLNLHKADQNEIIRIASLEYHPLSRKLFTGEKNERLSEMEGQLLMLFCSQSNMRITREQALNEIWKDEDQLKSRSLSVYINKLRKRLKGDDSIEIINVYGSGYQLVIN